MFQKYLQNIATFLRRSKPESATVIQTLLPFSEIRNRTKADRGATSSNLTRIQSNTMPKVWCSLISSNSKSANPSSPSLKPSSQTMRQKPFYSNRTSTCSKFCSNLFRTSSRPRSLSLMLCLIWVLGFVKGLDLANRLMTPLSMHSNSTPSELQSKRAKNTISSNRKLWRRSKCKRSHFSSRIAARSLAPKATRRAYQAVKIKIYSELSLSRTKKDSKILLGSRV